MSEEQQSIVPSPTEEQPNIDEQALVEAASDLPDVWGALSTRQVTAAHRENIRRAQSMRRQSHGLYTGVPMVCRGVECPFRETCWIDSADLTVGERCPIEIATIMEQYTNYIKELGIDESNKVDQGLVKQLIDVDIGILRADNKMAISADVVRVVIDTIS